MIVGVLLFGSRVAPYFGSSPAIVFYEVQQGNILEKWIMEPDTDDPMEMARKIAGVKTDVLVCGGIQKFCRRWLQLQGVVVVENQKGEAEQVIEKLMKSEWFSA
ncbi:MAG: NifB/NifX family molybdenum-iron cluster-binding protein [Desulfobacterales bacterium]|nr:NifB/NifX family molybdenum-iron cluster-binding protein [Desulfobacterales bacterium]